MSTRQRGMKRKATEAGELKAKRARGETDLADDLKWQHVGDVIKNVCPLFVLSSNTVSGSTKAVGFDIDFTVIKTASGRKFAGGENDWEWWDECVPDKLRQLNKDGYRVIFFTNQAGIEKMKVKPEELTNKIEAMIKELGIPVLAFVCTGENHFRKPSTMMWEYWEDHCNQNVKVDRLKCTYVGDAAGREKNWAPGKPKDFSCSDRKFAANLGVKFQTPEEFFLGEKSAKFDWRTPDPSSFLHTGSSPEKKEFHKKTQEMVILVGPPASGKSTFRKCYFEPHGYVTVNRDTMGTMQKCIKVATEALKSGKNVVADNTNPTVAARKDFIECAKKQGVPCRCFVMKTSLELCHHLNYVRQNKTKGEVRRVPDVGYNVYKKNFQAPSTSEGFTEIIETQFISQFDKKRDEELFKQWT